MHGTINIKLSYILFYFPGHTDDSYRYEVILFHYKILVSLLNRTLILLKIDDKLTLKIHFKMFTSVKILLSRSQWPRGPRRRSAAARLLRLWVRIKPGAWMFVCCECCVLSGRGLCDGLITRPEESYRL